MADERLPTTPALCQASRRDGRPCRAFACHGDTRCRHHGGRPARPPTCGCPAYRWPHRPGGGLCRWPDPPAGTCPAVPGRNRPNELRLRGRALGYVRRRKLNPIRDRASIAAAIARLHAIGRL